MTGKLSSSEPQAERIVQRLLPAGEEILWAARSRGPTWRQWFFFVLAALFIAAFATPGSPWSGLGLLSKVIALSCVWFVVGDWFYVFAVTPRRVIFLRVLPPRSWIFLDHEKTDVNWVRSHAGMRVIKFGGGVFRIFNFSGFWSHMTARRLGMKEYIDNVPDIEAVRGLILECTAAAHAAPAATPHNEIKIPPATDNRWIKSAK